MALVLDVQTRQGHIESNIIKLAQVGVYKIDIVGIADPPDYEDPTKSMTWGLYVFMNNEWNIVVGGGFQGQVGGYTGRNGIHNPVPSCIFGGMGPYKGLDMKVVLDIPNPFSFGVDITRIR